MRTRSGSSAGAGPGERGLGSLRPRELPGQPGHPRPHRVAARAVLRPGRRAGAGRAPRASRSWCSTPAPIATPAAEAGLARRGLGPRRGHPTDGRVPGASGPGEHGRRREPLLGRGPRGPGGHPARAARPERLGFCLDTCHLFAAGHDIRTAAGLSGDPQGLPDRAVGLGRASWHSTSTTPRRAWARASTATSTSARAQIGAARLRLLLRHPAPGRAAHGPGNAQGRRRGRSQPGAPAGASAGLAGGEPPRSRRRRPRAGRPGAGRRGAPTGPQADPASPEQPGCSNIASPVGLAQYRGHRRRQWRRRVAARAGMLDWGAGWGQTSLLLRPTAGPCGPTTSRTRVRPRRSWDSAVRYVVAPGPALPFGDGLRRGPELRRSRARRTSAQALAELHRVLRPGGPLHLSPPQPPLVRGVGRTRPGPLPPRPHVHEARGHGPLPGGRLRVEACRPFHLLPRNVWGRVPRPVPMAPWTGVAYDRLDAAVERIPGIRGVATAWAVVADRPS